MRDFKNESFNLDYYFCLKQFIPQKLVELGFDKGLRNA